MTPCIVKIIILVVAFAGMLFASIKHRGKMVINDLVQKKAWMKNSWTVTPVLYVTLLLVGFLLIPPAPETPKCDPMVSPDNYSMIRAAMMALITLAPPLYFFWEGVWVYGEGRGHDEDYKFTNDLATKIWAACAVVIGFYWYRHF